MEIVIKIIQFTLCFSLLVFVHEMGHFLFAKLFKIRVEKFYLFFNPGFSLFKFKYKGTEYGMGWIPFGGYVSIAGMVDETKDASKMASEPQPYEFRSKPAWQRLFVMIGGVLMNLITAITIFIFISYSQGSQYIKSSDITSGYEFTETAKELGFKNGDNILSVDGESYDNFRKYPEAIIINSSPLILVERNGEEIEINLTDSDIAKLLKDQKIFDLRTPFYIDSLSVDGTFSNAGIQAGDSIISVNGKNIKFLDELHTIIKESNNETFNIILSRKSSKQIDTLYVPLNENGEFGIYSYNRMSSFYKVTHIEYSFLESIPKGFVMTWDMCTSYLKQLKIMFNPEVEAYKSIGSVLTMGSLFPIHWDWIKFWNITAFFSVILAIMNMLPIPALDGGHVLFLLVELITRRKPSDKFMEKVQVLGFYLLMALMVMALWNDIVKFIL